MRLVLFGTIDLFCLIGVCFIGMAQAAQIMAPAPGTPALKPPIAEAIPSEAGLGFA
jgi:hypothetical protein